MPKNKDLVRVQRALVSTLNRMTQPCVYTNWDDQYARTESNLAIKQLQDFVKEKVDLASLSGEELLDLGFTRWDDKGQLYLVPLCLVGALRNGTILYDITGDKSVVGKDELDLDTRSGCIAYGIRTITL